MRPCRQVQAPGSAGPQESQVYQILEKQVLTEATKEYVVEAPQAARRARPGQFVIVRLDEQGERIPLTIADHDAERGTVTLVVQEVGKTTIQMGGFEAGETLATVAGPLGHATEIEDFGTVACVAGGVGIAPIFPIARALHEAGNEVISIIGARSAPLLFWEDKIASVSDELIVCTDDGTRGRHGLVTEPLQDLLEERGGEIARVWAIGPAVMMKFVSLTTKPFGTPTTVSLNTIMIDGTGMCGGCRVVVGEEAQFACVDGPEFDGHAVDWDTVDSRLAYYVPQEQEALERWERERPCQEVST
jgi:ferredoxin--NADP+ reductase